MKEIKERMKETKEGMKVWMFLEKWKIDDTMRDGLKDEDKKECIKY